MLYFAGDVDHYHLILWVTGSTSIVLSMMMLMLMLLLMMMATVMRVPVSVAVCAASSRGFYCYDCCVFTVVVLIVCLPVSAFGVSKTR